ncbi:MAG TPA: hypothetical protein VKA41_00145 [Solirubrobacterales bacterium]|nr:hypothetical protein [Solirubrobacterales bacterium]
MSFGDYLQGSIELIVLAAALGYGAVALRARLLPGWSGASARLAEVVFGLSVLVVTAELVGVVGLYRPGWVLLAAIVVGVGIGLALRPPRGGIELPAPAVAPIGMAVAVAAALLVAAHWAMPTQTGLDIGMYLPNTTWHNAPFAARFVQDHQVGALQFTEVLDLTVWFYPQNSELLHSVGVLFLGNDFLSPLLNIGWMSLCLLAAWCFARPYGGAPVAVLAIALVLDANMLLLYQPGDAKNDTAGLFFLLASAAVLVSADAQARAAAGAARPIAGGATETAPRGFYSGAGVRPVLPTGALIVAGLAAGLALGTKLNLLAPFAFLTLGVIAISAGYRWRATGIWVASSLVTGGFWFARNLVNAGNPLPWIQAGPLPGPDQLDINIRHPNNVAHYLLPPDGSVIRHDLIPGLHDSFGDLWPLVLLAVIGGFLLAIFRGRTPMIRMLGIVALLSGIAYLFTPLTAAGPEGDPTAFTTNLRYASPAIGLGAMLLAVDAGLLRTRIQSWLLGGLAILLLVQAVPIWDLGDEWEKDFVLGAIGLAFFLILVPAGLAVLGQRGWDPWTLGAGAVVALALIVAIGWPNSDDYVKQRYQASSAPRDFPTGMKAALAWFNRADPHDSRIAVVGGRPGFKQYIFYGDDLSNHVQYVARHGPHGAYLPIASETAQRTQTPGAPAQSGKFVAECREWITALNGGDYRYAVIGPDQRIQSLPPIEAVWTEAAGGTRIETTDDVSIFSLDRPLNADACSRAAGSPVNQGVFGVGSGSTAPQ